MNRTYVFTLIALFGLITACTPPPKNVPPKAAPTASVAITSHQDGDIITGSREITVIAALSDAESTAKFSAEHNGEPVAATRTDDSISISVTLTNGDNDFTITAANLDQEEPATASVTVNYAPAAEIAITSHQDGATITGSRDITITAALTNTDPDAVITANHNGTPAPHTRDGDGVTVAITLVDDDNTITITAANPDQEAPASATVNLTYAREALSTVTITSHHDGDIITGSRDITITAALTNTDPDAVITAKHNGNSTPHARNGDAVTVAIKLGDGENTITIASANPHQATPSEARVKVNYVLPPPSTVTITSHHNGDIITGSRDITITAALTNTDPDALITARHNGNSVAATRTGNTATVAITLGDNDNSIRITAANPHQEAPANAIVRVTFPFVRLSNGQEAAVVIGQPDFETTSETAANKAFGSIGGRPAIVGGRLYLPDSGWSTSSGGVTEYKGRVMGYHEVPTKNDAAADFVIGQREFSSTVNTPSEWAIARPQAVLAYKETLFVVDRSWNRILFFDGLPTATGASAKYVVGQPDFSSNDHDCAARSLNSPEGVTMAGTKLIVADRLNNRVLIWNGIPTRSGAPADMVLGQMSTVGCTGNDDNQGATQDPQPSNRTLLLPRDVWSDGERLAVLDTANNRVLIWTTFPTSSFTPADIVLGQSTFTTADSGSSARSFDGPRTLHSNGNQLFVTDTENNRVLVWNEFPTQNGQPADVVLGQTNMTENYENGGGRVSADGFEYPTSVYVHDNMLFVGDHDNDRYLVFNGDNP